MRDYAKVAPQFWTGRTGKALKAAGPEAVIVGMYLMTSPHANMIGVYHCPVAYIAIDTGLTIEGASKGLQSAIEADFCTFDESADYVFVHEFAAYQIGEEMDPRDKRCAGVRNELAKVPKGQCWQGFRARYAVPFHLPVPSDSGKPPASPSEAPSKPGAGEGAGEGTGAEEKITAEAARLAAADQAAADDEAAKLAAVAAKTSRGTRLPADWVLPKKWGAWAIAKYPHWSAEIVRDIATQFANHWHGKAGKDATKLDWEATWQNWCLSGITQDQYPPPRGRPGAVDTAARNAEARRLLGFAPQPDYTREAIDV